MNKLLLLLLSTYILLADSLPQTIKTTISSINKNGQVQLATSAPKGMSGIVIHNYSNGLSAITHSLVSQGNSSAQASVYTATLHPNIPSIQTPLKVNDTVILGNFYNNALVIAPNEKTYNQITQQFRKTWIHPDAYAIDFMGESEHAISLKSLNNFALINQVGLVLIAAEDGLLILDPISKIFLGKLALTPSRDKAINPFFTRFQQKDTATFSFKNINYTNYYQAIKELK